MNYDIHSIDGPIVSGKIKNNSCFKELLLDLKKVLSNIDHKLLIYDDFNSGFVPYIVLYLSKNTITIYYCDKNKFELMTKDDKLKFDNTADIINYLKKILI